MSIRSYKAIYEKFRQLFPELASMSGGFKGIRFADKHILIQMKDGSSIHFFFISEQEWALVRTLKEEV